MQRKSKTKSGDKQPALDSILLKAHENLRAALEQQVLIKDLRNQMLMAQVENLKKEIKALQAKKRPEKEIVRPSDAVCLDCPFNSRCKMKELGFTLCPQLMKINNQKYRNGHLWYNESIIQKEKIKFN